MEMCFPNSVGALDSLQFSWVNEQADPTIICYTWVPNSCKVNKYNLKSSRDLGISTAVHLQAELYQFLSKLTIFIETSVDLS